MNTLRLGLVAASIVFLFAPLRSDDSVYAPASGGFAVEHKLKSMVVSVVIVIVPAKAPFRSDLLMAANAPSATPAVNRARRFIISTVSPRFAP